MKLAAASIALVLLAASGDAVAGQATTLNFYPPEKLKPYTMFLGFDRDTKGKDELMAALQSSGTSWFCSAQAQQLKCPLNEGDAGAGSNVFYRGPHLNEAGATVSEFRVTLIADDKFRLTQLQPHSPAVDFLGQSWTSVVVDLGKPTNVYDDGSIAQNLYCAAAEQKTKPGAPREARLYLMYVHVKKATNTVIAVELATLDNALTALEPKPSC